MSCTKLPWYDWRLWYVTIRLSIPELMEQKDSQTRLGCLTSLVYNIILEYIVRSKGKEMDKLTHRLWCKHVEGQYHLSPRMGNIQISSLNLCHICLPHLMVWVWIPEMGLQRGEPQTEGVLGQWHTFAFSYWWEASMPGYSCSLPASLLNSSRFYLCSLGKGYVGMGFTNQWLN